MKPLPDPGRFHIGISGWTYKPWRDNFYPDGLSAKKELEYASSKLGSIEINGTFYRLQSPSSFARWYEATPSDFVFSVKASRYMTHVTRLKDFESSIGNFLASGLFNLREKLGPMLWQFPPSYKFDRDELIAFLTVLPHDTAHAAALARKNTLAAGKALTDPGEIRTLHHAMEIRHASFKTPDFIELLRRYNVSLVFADSVKWPSMEDVTGDIIYARLHGSEELYVSGYSEEAIAVWASRFRLWAAGLEPDDSKRVGDPASRRPREVFVYFDNDVKVHAPYNAQSLAEKLRC